jgi:hypothetical protein
MKKPVKCPANHKSNPKRAIAKEKRGFGYIAMTKSGLGEIEWCRKRDPFFHVKGKERHRLVSLIRKRSV